MYQRRAASPDSRGMRASAAMIRRADAEETAYATLIDEAQGRAEGGAGATFTAGDHLTEVAVQIARATAAVERNAANSAGGVGAARK